MFHKLCLRCCFSFFSTNNVTWIKQSNIFLPITGSIFFSNVMCYTFSKWNIFFFVLWRMHKFNTSLIVRHCFSIYAWCINFLSYLQTTPLAKNNQIYSCVLLEAFFIFFRMWGVTPFPSEIFFVYCDVCINLIRP